MKKTTDAKSLANSNDLRGAPWRRALVAVALLALGGCARSDVVFQEYRAGYVPDVAAKVATVDWAAAQSVDVTLSEFQFSPARLTFRAGVPYRLRLRNTGDRSHTFVSEDFFKAIAVGKLVTPDGEIVAPYVGAVALQPGAEKELLFVAVRPGAYGLACTIPLHESFGMEGEIVIR